MEYRTKEEQVADYLREGIISGRLPRGVRLKQTEIAQELKISITPVREALKLLEAEGYLSSDSYRGATVAPFDVEASTEILKLRITLETQLVESAVRNITAEEIVELRDLARQFEDAALANDSTAARGINYRFHRRMYDFARLPKTLHFVQVLWAQYPFDVINRIGGRALRAAKEHNESPEERDRGRRGQCDADDATTYRDRLDRAAQQHAGASGRRHQIQRL